MDNLEETNTAGKLKIPWRLVVKTVAIVEMVVTGLIYVYTVVMLVAWTVATLPHQITSTSLEQIDVNGTRPKIRTNKKSYSQAGLDEEAMVRVAMLWTMLTMFAASELFFTWLLWKACKEDSEISVTEENIDLWRKVKLFYLVLHPTSLCFLLQMPLVFVGVNVMLIIFHITATLVVHKFSTELELTFE